MLFRSTPDQIEKNKRDPERIIELVRVASAGMSDPQTGQWQFMYRPQDRQKATALLQQLGLNAQGQPLSGSKNAPSFPYSTPGSRVGGTEINESADLSDLKKLSGL